MVEVEKFQPAVPNHQQCQSGYITKNNFAGEIGPILAGRARFAIHLAF
jgi:hypothetical protein